MILKCLFKAFLFLTLCQVFTLTEIYFKKEIKKKVMIVFGFFKNKNIKTFDESRL